MSLRTFAKAVSTAAPLVFLTIGCGNSSSAPNKPKDADCPVGSEGCPCTSGKACDPGLVCFDPYCFKPNAANGAGGNAGQGGASPNGGGVAAGPGGGSPPNAGGSTAPDAAVGGSTNRDAGGTVKPASCPFPADQSTATEVTDLLKTSKDTVAAKFEDGRLVELDSRPCTFDNSGVLPAGDWSTYPCRDAYSCGGCLVFVVSPTDSKQLGKWFLLGANSATYGATPGCPDLSADYSICAPNCAGKDCGDDGCGSVCGGCGTGFCCNKQDKCIDDPCTQCTSACTDACAGDPTCLSSCCTGSGCQCEGVCPSPC